MPGGGVYGQATPTEGTYRLVSAGGDHTCAVRTDGTVACWGRNDKLQTLVPSIKVR